MKKNEKLYINDVFIGDVKKSIYRKINIGKSSEVTHRNIEVEFSDVNDSKKLKNIEITNKVLSDELDKEVQLRSELQMEIVNLQNKVDELNCKNHQLETELAYCAGVNEQLRQSLHDLEIDNEFLQKEHSKTIEVKFNHSDDYPSAKLFQDEIKSLKKDNKTLIDIIKMLEGEISKLEKKQNNLVHQVALSIEKVYFNNPTTVVIFNDGTKVVSKCSKDDIYDEMIGIAMCITKKMFGNGSQFAKYVNKIKKENQAFLNKKKKDKIKKRNNNTKKEI